MPAAWLAECLGWGWMTGRLAEWVGGSLALAPLATAAHAF